MSTTNPEVDPSAAASVQVYAAVVFDLDGTLLDTLQDLADSYNRVLAADGQPVHPAQAYRRFVGDGARVCVERALPESARQAERVDRLLAAQQADYAEHWHDLTRPYEGIRPLLTALAGRGLSLAVLSNKHQHFTSLCVNHFFADVPFVSVQGYEPGIPHKPDPTGARRLLQKLGVEPARALLLGDSAVDMHTARAAGMTGIGALWGFRDQDELVAGGAAALLRHPLDLLDLPGIRATNQPGLEQSREQKRILPDTSEFRSNDP